jgi:L-glutamine-phosphate cytidylyltransferase
MKAVILAAGRGSRMGSLTEARPKCLVEFRGKPLLQWQLESLGSVGIVDIAIVCGYRGDLLESYGLRMFSNPRWAETNMVSSLECAATWLSSEPCIVSYSDIFYHGDIVGSLMVSTGDLVVSYDPAWLRVWGKRFSDPLEDAETFRISSDGRIREIGGRPKSVEDVQGQFMGLLKFTPEGWRAVEATREGMEQAERDRIHMTRTLMGLIQAGFPVHGVPVASDWGEIDSDEDLKSQGG